MYIYIYIHIYISHSWGTKAVEYSICNIASLATPSSLQILHLGSFLALDFYSRAVDLTKSVAKGPFSSLTFTSTCVTLNRCCRAIWQIET